VLSGQPVTLAWAKQVCAPHLLGALPGKGDAPSSPERSA
jgi:xanthosine utilization system XapX-like protein